MRKRGRRETKGRRDKDRNRVLEYRERINREMTRDRRARKKKRVQDKNVASKRTRQRERERDRKRARKSRMPSTWGERERTWVQS